MWNRCLRMWKTFPIKQDTVDFRQTAPEPEKENNMLQQNIETFIGCDAEYEEAEVVLFGAPFDSTTSYRPGTRFGSKAIRSESYGLETYSPYQDEDLTDYRVFDSGDIELCMGNSKKALQAISERTATILEDGKVPFMIGGEHLITLGAFREVYKKYPDVCIVHFDAHTDLREDYGRAPFPCLRHPQMP